MPDPSGSAVPSSGGGNIGDLCVKTPLASEAWVVFVFLSVFIFRDILAPVNL